VGGGATGVALGNGVGGAGVALGEGSEVAVGARLADGNNVGGTSVGGGPGETLLTAATGLGVPDTLMLTLLLLDRLKKKITTASTTMITPPNRAIHGHRFDGSSAGGATLPMAGSQHRTFHARSAERKKHSDR
jgi:hypothetical protein